MQCKHAPPLWSTVNVNVQMYTAAIIVSRLQSNSLGEAASVLYQQCAHMWTDMQIMVYFSNSRGALNFNEGVIFIKYVCVHQTI